MQALQSFSATFLHGYDYAHKLADLRENFDNVKVTVNAHEIIPLCKAAKCTVPVLCLITLDLLNLAGKICFHNSLSKKEKLEMTAPLLFFPMFTIYVIFRLFLSKEAKKLSQIPRTAVFKATTTDTTKINKYIQNHRVMKDLHKNASAIGDLKKGTLTQFEALHSEKPFSKLIVINYTNIPLTYDSYGRLNRQNDDYHLFGGKQQGEAVFYHLKGEPNVICVEGFSNENKNKNKTIERLYFNQFFKEINAEEKWNEAIKQKQLNTIEEIVLNTDKDQKEAITDLLPLINKYMVKPVQQ